MTILKNLTLAAIVATGLTSCDNELNLVESKIETPVIYGLLDLQDTAQYIRVERAFIDQSISALTLAQNPDSLYYPNAVVQIIDLTDNFAYTLTEVDGNEEGYPREDGVFAQSPNTLYKINSTVMNLVPGRNYQLSVTYDETQPPATGTTKLLRNTVIDLPNANRAFDATSLNGIRIKFRSEDFGLQTEPIYDVFFEMIINETSAGQSIVRTITIPIRRNFSETDFRVENEAFYSGIRSALMVDPNVTRRIQDLKLVVIAGGEELANYIRVTQANLGITSSQDVPTYTNLSTGVGVFSSRNTARSESLELTGPSIDSLQNGRITGMLNFAN